LPNKTHTVINTHLSPAVVYLHYHDEEETARLTLPEEATERTKQWKTETSKKHTPV
jgi:hypothetical protein